MLRGSASGAPSTQPRQTATRSGTPGSSLHPRQDAISLYLELAKPRLTGLAVLTGLMGFLFGAGQPFPLVRFLATLLGTCLIGAGAGALNQVLEREADGKMKRTRNRPIPSGRIPPQRALAFGVAASLLGLAALWLGANLLAANLAAWTLILYLFVYTPLKSRSALCTLVGAVPGALPPMIGWAAAGGSTGPEAWSLFAILFLWQLPHFLALCWEHRADYARAGFKMLPVLDPEGGFTFRQMVLYALALIPASLSPVALGLAGWLYASVALAGGLAFFGLSLRTYRARTGAVAHRLFLASVLYLPALLATLTLDRMLG